MEHFAEFSSNNIVKQISAGKDGKINGDNLDIYVTTNDIRMNKKNRDYHFFASDWTADRADLTGLDNRKPLIEKNELLSIKLFLLNEEEIKLYKTSIKILLGRITTQYIHGFQWMDSVIPKHIPHALEETMKSKSAIYWLRIMLKNETCYSDCVQIMDEYERQLSQWYCFDNYFTYFVPVFKYCYSDSRNL
jgi:hypothetical protein